MMMTRKAVLICLWVVLQLGLGTKAEAQTESAPVLYRLEIGSSFDRGCNPPCTCPTISNNDIRGTYTLTFDHQDPLFTWYRVENVNWTVTIGGTDERITGSGWYRRGGEVAVQQQMTLELSVGGGPEEEIDSGLVGGAESFPSISITISANDMGCFDTAVGIQSKPVPATDITTYELGQSAYIEGCFAPCLCPVREWPMRGAFKLVNLPNATTPVRVEWAVVDVNWATFLPTVRPAGRFTGFGSYQIVEVGPTANQRMVLDFKRSKRATETRFDSGKVSGGTQFPKIDIDLSDEGFYCYGEAFFLHAAPK